MTDFLQDCVSWPTLPATVLLCLTTGYWLLVIIGGADTDLLDVDLDADIDPGLDGHESAFGWGLASLKWLNLGEVPLMLWLSAFALPAWLMSMTFDRDLVNPGARELLTAWARNFGVALIAAKLLTQPLRGKLKFDEPNTASSLIGQRVIITTTEATPTFGQARYAAPQGAPLMLNVRTVTGAIPKGTSAFIVDYLPETRLYLVEPESA